MTEIPSPQTADTAATSREPRQLLQLTGVSKEYILGSVRIPALREVDLVIHEGEFVAVWGPSGSGKSTLLNLIGLVDQCTEGTVRFDGQDIRQLDDEVLSETRNHKIGFVFQSFNLIPVLSALENVMLPLHIKGASPDEARKRAYDLLQEVELAGHIAHRPQKLSGGQQQRVAIARALVTQPLLVIADEPTANLDSRTAKMIISLMQRLNESRGTTFLFSTHDPRILESVRRRICLEDGRIVEG